MVGDALSLNTTNMTPAWSHAIAVVAGLPQTVIGCSEQRMSVWFVT